MKRREAKPYYYMCVIMRNGKKVPKQGTINSYSDLEALDDVYEMGKKVWERVVIEVTIIEPGSAMVLCHSTVGARTGKKLLPFKPPEKVMECDEGMGWINQQTTFQVHSFGTYFAPQRYPLFKGYNK